VVMCSLSGVLLRLYTTYDPGGNKFRDSI
jgi:hypothetical protein